MYILIISVITAFLVYLRYFPLGYDEDKHFDVIINQKSLIFILLILVKSTLIYGKKIREIHFTV